MLRADDSIDIVLPKCGISTTWEEFSDVLSAIDTWQASGVDSRYFVIDITGDSLTCYAEGAPGDALLNGDGDTVFEHLVHKRFVAFVCREPVLTYAASELHFFRRVTSQIAALECPSDDTVCLYFSGVNLQVDVIPTMTIEGMSDYVYRGNE